MKSVYRVDARDAEDAETWKRITAGHCARAVKRTTKQSCANCKHYQGIVRLKTRRLVVESFIDCYYIVYVNKTCCRTRQMHCPAWKSKTGAIEYKPGNGEEIIREAKTL